ncbi:hypothetical protein SZ39_1078 [Bacillus mycoides]|nr:hypothetical protein SZ39_1078 [Bacillus mycoides]
MFFTAPLRYGVRPHRHQVKKSKYPQNDKNEIRFPTSI